VTTYHIVISKPAENDLNDIVDYIAIKLRNPLAAKSLLTKITDTILILEKMPKRNALVKDERLEAQGIRKSIVENYIIFYYISVKENVFAVIRILYNRRNWNDLL